MKYANIDRTKDQADKPQLSEEQIKLISEIIKKLEDDNADEVLTFFLKGTK